MKEIGNKSTRLKSDMLRYRVIDCVLRSGLRVLPVWNWSERLALWWGFRFRPAPAVVKLRSGALMHFDTIDYLQLLIYYLGTFEPHCLPYFKSCAGRGATIIDVGANIGLHTLEGAMAVGPTGRVISIEAAPSNRQALKRNIELNHMKNVSVIAAAAGDSTGSATLSLASGGHQGMFTLGHTDGHGSYAVEVDVQRIDDVFFENEIASVDLIKMDIEGSEYRALRGALRTLQEFRPAILLELNENALRSCQTSSKNVKELLDDLGYRGWVIERMGIRPINSMQLFHNCDECLFVHRDSTSLVSKLRLPS